MPKYRFILESAYEIPIFIEAATADRAYKRITAQFPKRIIRRAAVLEGDQWKAIAGDWTPLGG